MTGPGTQTLVMDLQRELADLRVQLEMSEATNRTKTLVISSCYENIARQNEMLDEFVRQSHEDRDIIQKAEEYTKQQWATIARQSEALKKAWEALQWMIELHQAANDGAFENGVTDPTGSIDEGNVRASRIYDYARAAVRAIDEVMK